MWPPNKCLWLSQVDIVFQFSGNVHVQCVQTTLEVFLNLYNTRLASYMYSIVGSSSMLRTKPQSHMKHYHTVRLLWTTYQINNCPTSLLCPFILAHVPSQSVQKLHKRLEKAFILNCRWQLFPILSDWTITKVYLKVWYLPTHNWTCCSAVELILKCRKVLRQWYMYLHLTPFWPPWNNIRFPPGTASCILDGMDHQPHLNSRIYVCIHEDILFFSFSLLSLCAAFNTVANLECVTSTLTQQIFVVFTSSYM